MDTIREDVDANQDYDRSDAADAFLTRWEDPEEVSDHEEGANDSSDKPETAEESDDDEEILEVDDDESDTDPDDPSDDPDATFADDTAKVKLQIDGEEITASVKDLKRLYGQEAALTRKSQEVAAKRKEAEDTGAKHVTALQTLVKKAEERYQPYAGIDFLVASKQLDAEEFAALRSEATKAYEDYKFLTQELDGFTTSQIEKQQSEYQEKAKAAIEALSDPEKGIKGWSQDVYNEIRTFATTNGLPQETMDGITDPAIIKMMWQAMRYDKAKKVATTKTKKATTAKKTLRSKAPSDNSSFSVGKAGKALDKLRATGDREDAANAFLSRWQQDD